MYFSSTALTDTVLSTYTHENESTKRVYFFCSVSPRPFFIGVVVRGMYVFSLSPTYVSVSPCHVRSPPLSRTLSLSLSLSHWSLVQELLQRQWAAVSFVYIRIHGRQLEWDFSATSCSSEEIEIFAAAAAVEILHRSDQVAADCRAVWRAGRVDCRIVYVRGTYCCFEQQEFYDAFFLIFSFSFFFSVFSSLTLCSFSV